MVIISYGQSGGPGSNHCFTKNFTVLQRCKPPPPYLHCVICEQTKGEREAFTKLSLLLVVVNGGTKTNFQTN